MSKPIVNSDNALQRLVAVGSLIYPLVAHTMIFNGYPLWAVVYLFTILMLMWWLRLKSLGGRFVLASMILIISVLLWRDPSSIMINAVYLPPVLIPAGLAVIFIGSLGSSQGAMITRVAVVMENKPLDDRRVRYTRRLTLLWGIMFCAMVLEAILLAFFAPFEIWSWWVHIGNYVIIVSAFAIELTVRQRLFGGQLRVGSQIRALLQRPWYGQHTND